MPLELPPFVYVMGPSGAGKDSLLRYVRVNLQPGEAIAIAHRYITRSADSQAENHIALTPREFEERRAAGLFVFDWQAHDVNYGIGIETEGWRRAGFAVVVNGSRHHFSTLSPAKINIIPMMVTASPEALADRLARRGREDRAAILERLAREIVLPSIPSANIIDNSGSLEDAGRRLLERLRVLARPPVPA